MSSGLVRLHQSGDLHFVTVSCFRKRAIFDTAEPRDTFLRILEETRLAYDFGVYGYVVMSTHVHLLLSEPRTKSLSVVMQVLKQRFSRTRFESEVWKTRYHDFNVYSGAKITEKIEYMHMNPVTAGMVTAPADWAWSSYRSLNQGEDGLVKLTII